MSFEFTWSRYILVMKNVPATHFYEILHLSYCYMQMSYENFVRVRNELRNLFTGKNLQAIVTDKNSSSLEQK